MVFGCNEGDHMKKIDIVLLISILLISIFGIVMVYSASYVWAEYKFNDPYKFVKHQALFFFVGLILMYLLLYWSDKEIGKSHPDHQNRYTLWTSDLYLLYR